jgi:hypothetical protein
VEAKSPRRVKPRFQGANLPRGHQIGKLTGLLASYKRITAIAAAQGANPRLVTSSSGKNKVELLQG